MAATTIRDLAVVSRKLSDLVPYARNARTHSEAQIALIAKSIMAFGWTNPILIDDDGGVIAGHGRLLAAEQLGLEEVPCIAIDNLTPEQKSAYIIADNRLAEDAGWDRDTLKLELGELQAGGFDLSLTGFKSFEIASLLDDPNFAPGDGDMQGRLDKKEPVRCPECGHEFEPA